jgi:hypothetical protein
MHFHHRVLLAINVLGGAAVLGSYALGLLANPGQGAALWGNVPAYLRPAYGISMILATVGYFAFSYLLFFKLDPATVETGPGLGFGFFHVLFLTILLPSALWMPLTFGYLANPSEAMWLAVRVVLALVGMGAVLLVAALTTLTPRPGGIAYALAVAGAVAFAMQTALLDGLIWPAYFPKPSALTGGF